MCAFDIIPASSYGNPFTYVLLSVVSPSAVFASLLCVLCLVVFAQFCAPDIHHTLFLSRSSARENMPTSTSAACIAVITVIVGVSDAFVAPSLSCKIDARRMSNTRAGRSSCLSMGADGGTTRGETREDVIHYNT